MFKVAILIGIYSYLILLLGVLGLLYRNNVVAVTLFFIFLSSIYLLAKNKIKISKAKIELIPFFLILIIILQACVNFIGVLGPEISFDALWYHLTLPKIFILSHKIFHIPGNLLYYSDIPKLTEMLYLSALSITGNEVFAKSIHFSFGLISLLAIYKISRKFLSKNYSIFAAIIFYSNLVVGWESISSYVDLSRTFFEALSFLALLSWAQNKKIHYFYLSAILLGFGASAKLISIFEIPVFSIIIFYILGNLNFKKKIYLILKFILISLLVVSPWLVISYLSTGNPIYPYFSLRVDNGHLFNLPTTLNFISLNDPINPIYIIILPLVIFYFKKLNHFSKPVVIFVVLSFILWLFTQEQRGTRFLLPTLAMYSVLIPIILNKIKEQDVRKFLILVILFLSIISIGYRFIANVKFIPYIIGWESRNEFLAKYLNFNFGDFADVDNYFKNHIKQKNKVLLYGFQNLYYVDFPFVDASYVKKGDKFDYVATQSMVLPARFQDLELVYSNDITHVKLYSVGKMWEY